MGISLTDLRSAVSDNLILSGKAKDSAEKVAIHAVRNALKLIWRMNVWSFSVKTSTLSIVAGKATGYTLPTDCEAIGGIRRLTANDYGYKLHGETEDYFDTYFPYPAQHSSNPSMYYKVEYDATTRAPLVYLFPASNETVSGKIIYKVKFSDEAAAGNIPDDFEPLILAAAYYFAAPIGSIESVTVKAAAFSEFERLLNKYKMKDRPMYESVVGLGSGNQVMFSPDSWQYILEVNHAL